MSRKKWFFLALGIAAVNYTVGAVVWYNVGKDAGVFEERHRQFMARIRG